MPTWHPGYYGVSLSDAAARALTAVADVMIPGTGVFPRASDVGVTEFISARVNPIQLEQLESMLADVDPAGNAEAIADWLGERQTADANQFVTLRYFIYTAYYSAPEVVRALNRRGFDYHGAPQPYGYEVAEDIPLPDHRRGSFIPTDAVRNVLES
jgi:hypothetical protein